MNFVCASVVGLGEAEQINGLSVDKLDILKLTIHEDPFSKKLWNIQGNWAVKSEINKVFFE